MLDKKNELLRIIDEYGMLCERIGEERMITFPNKSTQRALAVDQEYLEKRIQNIIKEL